MNIKLMINKSGKIPRIHLERFVMRSFVDIDFRKMKHINFSGAEQLIEDLIDILLLFANFSIKLDMVFRFCLW